MADYSSRELQSEFRWNQKLRNCADYDKDHIGENSASVGDWMKLIHKALNVWARKPHIHLPPIPETNTFTKITGDRIEKFKEFYGILNYKNEIDRIVGKKTVYWLDKELPRQPFEP